MYPEEILDEEPEPWWKRAFIISLALFLVLLVLSFSFFDAFIGIVQSKVVDDKRVLFSNATIVFSNDTLQLLQAEFLNNPEREIKACLFGEANQAIYTVTDVTFPRILRANALHVLAELCPKHTSIELHSHPINQCIASRQDIAIYRELKQVNRMAVMHMPPTKTSPTKLRLVFL